MPATKKNKYGLTPNEKIFADEWLIDRNGTRAYRVAYKSCKTDKAAGVGASKTLEKARVAQYIENALERLQKRAEVKQEDVITEYAKIAFADITDFVAIKGGRVKVKDTDNMPRDKIAAISSIKEGPYGIEIKLAGKTDALSALGRHLGMFRDKLELSGEVNANNPFADLTTEELKKMMELLSKGG